MEASIQGPFPQSFFFSDSIGAYSSFAILSRSLTCLLPHKDIHLSYAAHYNMQQLASMNVRGERRRRKEGREREREREGKRLGPSLFNKTTLKAPRQRKRQSTSYGALELTQVT